MLNAGSFARTTPVSAKLSSLTRNLAVALQSPNKPNDSGPAHVGSRVTQHRTAQQRLAEISVSHGLQQQRRALNRAPARPRQRALPTLRPLR
jgi:hypothetical protein